MVSTARIFPRAFSFSTRRTFTTRPVRLAAQKPAWTPGPSPPPLPKEEQAIFEKLQAASTGAFSTPRINQSPDSTPSDTAQANAKIAARARQEPELKIELEATGEGEELHPDVRRGAKDEFEGEVNPRTGEVGGPKREPQRWGTGEGRDWSYNGRVTDF